MQKRRLLPLVALSLSIGLMSACDSTSSNSPTISSPILAKDANGNTIDAGSTLTTSNTGHLTGTVTNVANWVWVVENASGIPVDTLIASHSPAGAGDTKLGTGSDVLIPFTPTAKWGPTGVYSIVGILIGTGGGTTTTPAITFNAVPGGSSGTSLSQQGSALSVGGFFSTSSPSFIGLNPVATYSGIQTAQSYASVDLVVTANASGSVVFESTAAGVSNGDLTSSYWGNGRATLIQSVSTAPTTKEGAAAALTSTLQTATITSGGIYVAKTVEGTYAVLTVSNLSGTGDAATLNVTVLE